MLCMVTITTCRVLAAEVPDKPADRRAIEKTGDVPDATPLKRPAVLWKFTAKRREAANAAQRNRDGGIGVSDPVYFDGVVYFGDDSGTVHAIRANDGRPLWET